MNDFAARGRCPALPPLCRPSGRRLARWSSPRALGGLALLCLAASAASTATSARGGATTFSLHEGLEIREVDFSKGAGAGAGAWPAPLAAFLGFSLAALIMVPAVVAGPTVAMPPAFGVLFYQLAMLAGQSWFPCIVSATVGVPFAHGLLLVPSITFQYALCRRDELRPRRASRLGRRWWHLLQDSVLLGIWVAFGRSTSVCCCWACCCFSMAFACCESSRLAGGNEPAESGLHSSEAKNNQRWSFFGGVHWATAGPQVRMGPI
ncbi:unnamed protein product [Durusdinium trenchii]|uniref:Uncharacterized protein n=1 Tax=Durusdinium trenchii TaxID=1381693 RepID=A0ABP0SFZ4_9DINO